MNIPAKILSNILDNNAKDLMSNVNTALLDKVQSRIEEMRKGVIAKIYDGIEEGRRGRGDDKDGDGDGDFADIMMTRMMASGMSREEAMKKTRKHNKGKGK